MSKETKEPNDLFSDASAEQKKAFEKSHRKVYTFDCDGLELVFRKPSAIEWRIFEKAISEDSRDTAVPVENFATSCLLWPERAQHGALFEEYPALPNKLATELSALCKGEKADYAKKLLTSLRKQSPTCG